MLGLSAAPAPPGDTAWAVRRVLEAAARDQPLLVVIDDAHWGDATLLDLVEYTLAFSGGGAILLLCLARPELLETRPGWAAPRTDSTLLQLEPLGGDDARRAFADHFVGIEKDFVMHLGASLARHFEPEADFHTLHGLNAHQGLGKPAVQFQVPLGVRAQSRR